MKFDSVLTDALKTELMSGTLVPFLLGEPGIGKSSLVEGIAGSMGTKCFTLACNQLADKADLTGQRLVPTGTKDANGNDRYKQVFFPHQVISDAIEYAENHPNELPILFLDELNRTTPDITSACLSLPTLRQIGSSKLPDNLKIIAAGNDKGNVTSLDSASISRFVPYRVEPDTQTYLSLDPNLNKYVRKTLEKYPNTLFGKPIPILATNDSDDDDDDDDTVLAQIDDILGEDERMEQFTTPRTITGISNWLNAVSDTKLVSWLTNLTIVEGQPTPVLQEMIEAHVGHTEFSMALLKEITESVQSSPATPAASVTIAKPVVFDQLKACQTMDEINQIVSSLDDKVKSATLLYCLYDRSNNSTIIRALTAVMTQMEVTDIVLLSKAANCGMLDDNNLDVCYSTNTPVAASMQSVLSI